MGQQLVIKNARISFPHLVDKGTYQGTPNKNYSCKFILDPDENEKGIAAIEKAIKEASKGLKKKPSSEKVCLQDGDEEREETEGMMVLSTMCTTRPIVLGSDKKVVSDADYEQFVAGHYANIKIDVFPSKKWGRISCGLEVIQYAKAGESLGKPAMSAKEAAEGFEDVDDEMFD